MTHVRTPAEVCAGKVGYRKRKYALTALNYALAQGTVRNGKQPTGVYKCPVCGDWHLTSRGYREQAA